MPKVWSHSLYILPSRLGTEVDVATHQLFLGHNPRHNTGARVVDDCHVRGVHALAEKLHTADTEFQF